MVKLADVARAPKCSYKVEGRKLVSLLGHCFVVSGGSVCVLLFLVVFPSVITSCFLLWDILFSVFLGAGGG